jgi:hypothetical protein
MLLGGYLGFAEEKKKGLRSWYLILVIILFFSYFLFGFLVSKGFYTKFQMLIHLLTFPIVYLLLRMAGSQYIVRKIKTSSPLRLTVSTLSQITLEIYLLQGIVYTNIFVNSLAFPFNFLMFWIIVIAISKGFFEISDMIRSKLPSVTKRLFPAGFLK